MPNTKMPPVFFKKRDLLLAALLLVVAAVLFALFRWNAAPAYVAVVSVGVGETENTQRISLANDGLISIEGGALPTELLVENGGIRFVNSTCPDHLCEEFGHLQYEGDWASCLPAEVFVRIEHA